MNIRHLFAAGLAATTLSLVGLASTVPAQAASVGSCMVNIPAVGLTVDLPADDTYSSALDACAAGAHPTAVAAPIVSHNSAMTIELAKPLPAKLAREIRAYEAS